ncbi:MAG TPA: ABC transporter ATP-binding protein, partial [Bacteroidales bacterium]|nr:ABC transporter ATP-binding protein [Bacteroidales bacterium]
DKLYKENINVNRIQGRFKGIRKLFYRFVKTIPVIGKKKIPFKALKGVSFEINNGMFGLLGPNGAGKSTLMRIICGILEPSYGQITINNFDVREKREELQGLIGYLPQEFGMYENLTAWEFLNYMGILKKLYNRSEREERVDYVLGAVHMLSHKNEKIGSFSGGMKQRIGIAQILMHLPRILVVDEPTAGLDPRERIRFRNLLVELSRERIVIFSTHIIEDVASSCNKVAVVKGGQVKYLGEPIQMANLAEGKIWMIDMSMDAFETFKESHVIIHHMRDGDNIRVRCLAENKPNEEAKLVKANLEDAYLWLLSN